MPAIYHTFPVRAPASRVFAMFTTPVGLDAWWTAHSSGEPVEGSEYTLWFGPEYDWRGRVTAVIPDRRFELELTAAIPDWSGTRVRVDLEEHEGVTTVRFAHDGWADASEHYRVSSYCWAMYLRHLRRYVERGVVVPYEARLDD